MSRHIDFVSAPALLVLILSIGLIVQLILPSPAPTPLRRVARADPTLAPVRFAPTPDPTDFLARPIFNPNRAGSGAVTDVGAIALIGVASTGANGAVVLRDTEGDNRVLQMGESLDGWRLVGMTTETAAFQRGAQTATLRVGAQTGLPQSGAPGGTPR